MVRGPGRGRATTGAMEVGRREMGSSTEPGGTADGALGAPTPASTGSGAETGAAVAFGGGAATTAATRIVAGAAVTLGAAEVTGTSRPAGGGLAGASAAAADWGVSSSNPTACLTRSMKPTRAGSGSGSGAGAGSGSGWATMTRSPVHSRNLPQEPQNV